MDNIRRTLHILDQINKNKTSALIVGLDPEKAFDLVRWAFLYRVLGKFGFHEKFVKTIQSLYNKPVAQKDKRQGCPISPLLFTLFIKPLGQLLRQSEVVKRMTMAETEGSDVCRRCFGVPGETSIKGLMTLLEDFGKLSGSTS